MPEWTPRQKEAIETGGKNLLVAAAAGSGKTAVLVERIIQQVLGGACDVDKLLVMTFTDAAAREMRQRVESSLEKALEAEMDPKRAAQIERQLVLLSGASISTIHKFCIRVLQRHFEAIDLDPEFRIGNEQELALLRQDVIEQLFEEEYDKGTASFLQFVDDYGDDRGDDDLYALVERVYAFSLSQPFPDDWLDAQAAAFDLGADAKLSDTVWYPIVLDDIRLQLQSIEDSMTTLVDDVEASGADAYPASFRKDLAGLRAVRAAARADDWDQMAAAFAAMKFGRLSGKESVLGKEEREAFQKRRNAVKEKFQTLEKHYFSVTQDEFLDGLHQVAPDMHELVRLTKAFREAFRQAKKERGIVDFSDLEHFALAVLLDRETREREGRIAPSDVALSLQQKYHEVMVDEYQDTNGVQETIILLVTKQEPPNLFVVGDVKQSIYRFRLADPSLFLRKYVEYPKHPETCQRIDLSQNFRSRPEVLAAINDIFAQVMVPGTMELAYDEAAALHPGPDYPPADGPTLSGPQELAILCKDEGEEEPEEEADGEQDEDAEERTSLEQEAQYIADRIRQFMQEKTLVYHKEDKAYHPIAYRDIVILMRSTKQGRAESVRKVLQENDIPAYTSSDASYFESSEVRLMLSLLSVLDNARQDIPLAAVLLSPIGGFTLTEMAMVRLADPDGDIFSALLTAARPEKDIDAAVQQKAASFLARLTRWRDLARGLGVPELVWQLYRETGYYDYVGGLPGGLLKQANLRMLASRAAEYEATNFRGLFRFLRFVKRMRDMNTDLAAARTLGESEDVVRIMSIHGSKGLEFPLVFVARLGGKFNLDDAKKSLLPLHKTYGFGPYAVDAALAVRYKTFANYAVAAKIIQETKAEEMRLLYVALTRARERLILVGYAGKPNVLDNLLKSCGRQVERTHATLPDDLPLSADHMLDWVLMALLHHPAAKELRARADLPEEVPAFLDYQETSDWRLTVVPTGSLVHPQAAEGEKHAILAAVEAHAPLPESRQKEAVEALLSWSYPSYGLEEIPSKLSVSELKRRFAAQEAEAEGVTLLLEQPETSPWKRPRFLQETTRLTGAEYGSLMHSVLQYIDITGELTPAGIREQVAGMVERELLTKEEAVHVDTDAVTSFYASSIGQRLRHAARIWRELPFSRLLPAKRFYETAGEGETLLIQGVIDLLFEEPDGTLVLVDYKTDSDTRPEKIRKRYALQVDLYSEAVSAVLGKEISERMLYLLHDGTILNM